jgi:hypothetical protein
MKLNSPAPDATGIDRLHALLDWRLLRGSHKFPGPAGGTCILEAAVVVAGMPYVPIANYGQTPTGFSPMISEYLMRLNDFLPDEPRQQLIRFVPRLAGSADIETVEQRRVSYIVAETRKRVLPIARRLGWSKGAPLATQWWQRVEWAAVVAGWPLARTGELAATQEEAAAVMKHLLGIIDGALRLGQQAEPIEPLLALARLESVRPPPSRRVVAKVA